MAYSTDESGHKPKRRILEIQRGRELQVCTSDRIWREDAYSYPAYRQAMRAISGIMQRTQSFHWELSQYPDNKRKLDDSLFSYGSNVIAFSAERGGGKTRTMLSFAQSLARRNSLPFSPREKLRQSPVYPAEAFGTAQWNGECPFYSDLYSQKTDPDVPDDSFLSKEGRDALDGARFFPLTPISPSVLTERQNILHVILTRLYHYAKEQSEQRYPAHSDQSGRSRLNTPRSSAEYEDGNRLWDEFQKCRSGIQGLTQKPSNDQFDELMDLEEMSDGLVLIRHFYQFVQEILKQHRNVPDVSKAYLVLQIDDADSQVSNGFEVLEDIRKYLQIPNLIILMSTDMDLMHAVVLENHLQQFQKQNLYDDADFSRMCRKYIDKLVPPSHLITLTPLNIMIEQATYPLHLRYLKNGESILKWSDDANMDLQDTILMLIHRKTGVVFARPASYPHNLLPVTMRGLNQLLYLLMGMEDVPLLEQDIKNFETAQATADAFARRIAIQENNLSQFFDYFSRVWIPSKVAQADDRKFLDDLSGSVSAQYVPLTVDYLWIRYNLERFKEKPKDTPEQDPKKNPKDNPEQDPKKNPKDDPEQKPSYTYTNKKVYTQVYLDVLMNGLKKDHNTIEDYYLLFAIRTLFTLNHHKMALQQQSLACAEFQKAEKKPPFFLVDYDPKKTYLATAYGVNEQIKQLKFEPGKGIVSQITKNRIEKLRPPLNNTPDQYRLRKELLECCLVSRDELGCDSVNFTSILTLFLRLGAKNATTISYSTQTIKKVNLSLRMRFYLAQETALTIATNWDVQDQLYKKMRMARGEEAEFKSKSKFSEDRLIMLFSIMDRVLAEIGNGFLVAYHRKPVDGILPNQDLCLSDTNSVQPWSVQAAWNTFCSMEGVLFTGNIDDIFRYFNTKRHKSSLPLTKPEEAIKELQNMNNTEDETDQENQNPQAEDPENTNKSDPT